MVEMPRKYVIFLPANPVEAGVVVAVPNVDPNPEIKTLFLGEDIPIKRLFLIVTRYLQVFLINFQQKIEKVEFIKHTKNARHLIVLFGQMNVITKSKEMHLPKEGAEVVVPVVEPNPNPVDAVPNDGAADDVPKPADFYYKFCQGNTLLAKCQKGPATSSAENLCP